MISLDRFDIFRAVVEAGSLTGAANALGQTRAVVSFNIKRLEEELGVSLLTRSTRRMALTQAGERFYQRCLDVLDAAQLAVDDARLEHNDLKGTLRITTTTEYGVARVVPLLDAFSRLYPALRIHLSTSTRHADLISERFDVAIRLGRIDDSTHRAVRIARFEIRPVAAPALLKRLPGGTVATLDSLRDVPWLEHSRLAEWLPWKVTTPDGGSDLCRPAREATITTDNAATLRAFALAGMGVAMLPMWLIRADLDEGRLCNLLPGYGFPVQEVYALYPDTRHVPSKVRSFIDFIKSADPGDAPFA